MKYLVLGAIASLAFVGIANAEGFDGPYAGVARANSQSTLEATSSGAATFKLSSFRSAFRGTNGEGFAGQAGYNTQFRGMFVGVEVNYNGAEAGKTYANRPHTVTLSSTVDQLTDIRVRFGGEIESNLFYLFAGAAQADTSITATSEASVKPVTAARTDAVSGSHSGAVFGGGVTHRFFDRFSGFVEVAHYELGEENYDFPVASKFGTNVVELSSTAVKIGANFHFK